MPVVDSVKLLRRAVQTHPDTACILLTGSSDLAAVLAVVHECVRL